jgi:hypothetical protein
MAGAIGVCIGALSFAFNMRASTKSRQVALVTTMLQSFNSPQGWRDFMELISMEWVDFEDYSRKYDSSVNFENFIKRMSLWELCDYVGWQYCSGLVDMETIYYMGVKKMVDLWNKFKPIIEKYRRTVWEPDDFSAWEHMSDSYTVWAKDNVPKLRGKWKTQ